MNANNSVALADLSRILSRLDNARAVYTRRHGYQLEIARKAKHLEERLLATRSESIAADVDTFSRELFRG